MDKSTRINTNQTLKDIMKLPPNERRDQFLDDSKIITSLIQDFSLKYKGYLVGISVTKFPQTFDWGLCFNMDGKLMSDEASRYHGDKT